MSDLFLRIYQEVLNEQGSDLVLTDVQAGLLARELENFVKSAITKFIKGQKEHGGDLSDRNLSAEIDNEIIDLVIYRWRQRSLEKI